MIGTLNPYWQNYVTAFGYSNTTAVTTIASKLAIVDSGWTTFSGPAAQMNVIIAKLKADANVIEQTE